MSEVRRTPEGKGAAQFRCGYVALAGRPNVGKSTLMNRMLGGKLSIVTPKPQTTRQRICGIKTASDGQVVFVDTPGMQRAARKALNRYMNRTARAALVGVDLVLLIVEAGRWTQQDDLVAQSLESLSIPVFLVLNKIDRISDKLKLLSYLESHADVQRFDRVFLVSALSGDGVDELERCIMGTLPFGRPLYDEDQLSDRSERFLAAELIREQLMMRLHQELPYALTVEIETFEHSKGVLRIGAIIWVEREGQKKIVIGKGGETLKQAASRARKALEAFFDEKVFLETWVKVSPDWSDDEQLLKKLGYKERQ